ncbi:MAG: hypothetical protein IPO81_09405 [Kouleothrix sp.]|nr:hypothetical protein [Kouleothrix sp.]
MKLTNRTLKPIRPKPWRRCRPRPRPYPREIMLMDRPPLAQICIYDSCVVLTRREASGAWRSYPISPDALAQALGKLPVTAGLLPEGTVGAGLRDGDAFYVQHVPAATARLQLLEGGQASILRVMLPPLIWAGWRDNYRIFALGPDTPLAANTPLYHAPFPNVYPTGVICWGDVRVQRATPTTLPAMRRLFLEESQFNSHLDTGKSKSGRAAIAQLRYVGTRGPDTPYPLRDLLPAGMTLGALLDGSAWRRS